MKTSCTIIISHFENLNFLHTCIRQTRKHTHPDISQHIIIVDQSHDNTHAEVAFQYANDSDVTVIRTDPWYSGYGVDIVMRKGNIKTEYVVQLHVDAFGISDQWLKLPITLMQEYNLAFAGQLQFISSGDHSIYAPGKFFAMAQCFNVGRTDVYREMSEQAGFLRFHNRAWLNPPMEFKCNHWAEWAKDDYENRGSDDDVVAFHWQDVFREDNKLGLAVTGFIEPSYGRIIESIVFHFGSANEARGTMDTQPELYRHYTQRINQDYSDALIDEMVNLAKSHPTPETQILSRNFWNGRTKEVSVPTDEMNKRIEELKNK